MIDTAGKEATRYCGGCHDPIALLSGGLTPGAGLDSPYSHEGSSCLLCHSINQVRHLKGSGSFLVTPARRYLFANRDGKLWETLNALLIRTAPELHQQELSRAFYRQPEYCAVCHKQYIQDPNHWGWIKLQDQYGEWLESRFSGRNTHGFNTDEIKVCQDCHMPLVASNDPAAGADGKVRSHRFIAANTAIPWLDGDHTQFQRTKAWLKGRKMYLFINPPRDKRASRNLTFVNNELYRLGEPSPYVTMGEEARLQVAVTNANVGHSFPNGPIDSYQAWLEVKVVDGQQQVVFWSGDLDDQGYVKREQTRFYHTLGVDRRGRLINKHNLWDMIGNSYKKRIPPGSSNLTTYTFQVPYWVKGDLTVTARLRYRRFNKWFTDWVFEGKDVRLPIIDMARDTLTIPVRKRPEAKSAVAGLVRKRP